MRRDAAWLRWFMGSARTWKDLERLVIETGIDSVDSDHRIILEAGVALNRLAMKSGATIDERIVEEQGTTLATFLDYTKFHFAREEVLMKRLGTPNADEQARAHARIIERLTGQIEDFEKGRVRVSPATRRMVMSWIVDHIAGLDVETFHLGNLVDALAETPSWDTMREVIRSTGVDSLDSGHRSIGTAIVDSLARFRNGASAVEAGASISRLEAAARAHFAEEEAFMGEYGVPGLDAQEETHRAFAAHLADAAAAPPMGSLREFGRELVAWLTDHVNGTDYDCFRRGDWLGRCYETMEPERIFPLVRRTGVRAVDEDHLGFVGIASETARAMREGDGPRAESGMGALAEFARAHFAREESLFPDMPLAKRSRHAAEHESLLAALLSFRDRAIAGKTGSADAIRGVVLGWWIHHTNQTDIDTFGSPALSGGSR